MEIGAEWYEAARSNDVFTLKCMIAAGQPINAQSEFGFTALHTAAANERVAAVRALLEAGADPLLRTFQSHPDRQFASITPLQLAQWHRRTQVIPLLAASSGESPEQSAMGVEAQRSEILQQFERKFQAERMAAREANNVIVHATEWQTAARNGDVASLRRQLSQGQAINQRNVCGQTALHFAAKDGNEEAVEFHFFNL